MTNPTPMAANDMANEDDAASRRRIHLREISGDADAPLETVGQDLRAARIRRGDDLAAVSRALKIRKDHLDALESDQLDRLPGKTYAIGFVRSYARYLGLEAGEMVERFKAEIAGRGDEPSPPAASLHEDDGRRLPYGWRILAGVIGIALLWGIWHIFGADRDAAPPVPPPPSLAHETPRTVTPPTAMTAPAAQQQADAATPPATASAGPSTQAAPAAAEATASQATPSQQAAVPAVPGQPGQVFGEQNRDSSRIMLRATGATRITVRGADGRLYINRDLAPGEVYYVPNFPGLNLALSNAGAVEAELDGKALGRIGQENQVVGRVSLDPQSLSDRYNAR
jgi:cytoskeleton protein RodZ